MICELATIFLEMDGKYSHSNIKDTDSGFCAFCDFLLINGGGLKSIFDLTSTDAGRFFEYCRSAFPTGWQNRYVTFRARLSSVVDISWPQMSFESKPTEGFSVIATTAMRDALIIEIDRIRSKIGRLKNDLEQGKVLDIDLSAKNVRAADIPGFMTANKADIIKTILYHIPQFPLDHAPKSCCAKATINPGQWLLLNIRANNHTVTSGILSQHFNTLGDLYDYYFPTSYDATCILLFWALVTGWNRQVIESVGSDEINLRFNRNHLMNAWSEDHVMIRGKKTRGQPKNKPKYFTHISDINDQYGLFNVLRDFYELTKTIRFGRRPGEDRCIIMGVQSSGDRIGCFGPGVKISTFGKWFSVPGQRTTNVDKFFSKHEIYDDADTAEPQVRIKTASWRQLRTSYETVLEDMNLPLYARQMLLGHSSIDTTMSPYGSDQHTTKEQMKRLGEIISEVHEDYRGAKYFQGALLLPENDPRKNVGRNQKVVHFARTDWKDNIIMLCGNSRNPNWPGHEFYVKSGEECNHLAKCLFCRQCLIGRETLPYLAQWDMDIQEYFDEEGDWDSDLKWLELQQAIKEVFEIWSRENNQDDVKWAKATAMRSDFQRIPLDIWHIVESFYAE